MSRLPRPSRALLDERQGELFDAIAGGPRASSAFSPVGDDGGLVGPFNAMLLHPPIGDPLQRLGAAIRYRGTLSDRAREIAVLLVAAHAGSAFEQYAHERIAVHIGLSDAEIAVLHEGRAPVLADPGETAVATATLRILDRRALDDDEYAEAVDVLGAATLFELTTLIGYYQLLATQLRVFGVDRPAR